MEDKVIVKNRKATHDFFIEEDYCAGIKLIGCEVKSIMNGDVSIAESYIEIDKNKEVWIVGCHVKEYTHSSFFNSEKYNPTRKRKLLLNKSEINKLYKRITERGYTIVPLRIIYRNKRIKIIIGLAKGKRMVDKRHALKDKQINRDMQRDMKSR